MQSTYATKKLNMNKVILLEDFWLKNPMNKWSFPSVHGFYYLHNTI